MTAANKPPPTHEGMLHISYPTSLALGEREMIARGMRLFEKLARNQTLDG
jgi:hypothetical protein